MANLAQRAFNRGELSPSLYARTDLQAYGSGLRTCRNFMCLRDGGATNRPGTEHVGLCPATGAVNILPFVFNDAQSYVLEFSALSLRIIQEGGYLAVAVATPYLAAEVFELQITQSADVLTIVHVNHPTMELKRLALLTWTLTRKVFGPKLTAPTGFFTVPAASGGTFRQWVVTAISETSAESYPSIHLGISSVELPQNHDLFWDPVPGATGYNIYEKWYGTGGYGWIGTSVNPSFSATGQTPDFTNWPLEQRVVFAAIGDYPGAVGCYQQRQIYAGSTNDPEKFFTSRSADLDNFTVSVPTQDDDAITATLVSKKVNAIRHIVDGDNLYLLTSGGEWVLRGDGEGVIRPTDINPLNFSKHGASLLPPIVIDRRVLYVQARQAIVRQIVSNEVGPGYEGENLTLLSSHLFKKGFTLVDWAYQEEPYSIIWVVRSDGVLLGLTDLEEQKVLAWHHHDTDGAIESVCVVPEGAEERLYMVVNRNGVRMVERMASRSFLDVRDAIFMDSALTYDGRNATANTMALSGSTSWDEQELVTVTSSIPAFSVGEIGNRIDFVDASGLPLRVTLTEPPLSTLQMQGFPNRIIPAELRGAATTTWTRAVDTLSGLSHLEGKTLAVTADGYVVCSPNNDAYHLQAVVSGGSITLDQPYGYIHAGLPYISDLETLDIDTPSGQSVKATKMLVNNVTAYLEESRGFFAGQSIPTGTDPLEHMVEFKIRDVSDDFGLIDLKTDADGVVIPATWNGNGRIAIRQVDPIPLTILAVIPRGHLATE